jgi:hypothetical protein
MKVNDHRMRGTGQFLRLQVPPRRDRTCRFCQRPGAQYELLDERYRFRGQGRENRQREMRVSDKLEIWLPDIAL